MTAAVKIEVNDPFAAVRALNRLRTAGFALSLDAGRLLIKPISRLTDVQRAYLHTHKPALLALLMDAAELHAALKQAGTDGLAWREGTPAEWSDTRLLAAGEVLYSDGRMVNRQGRRYATQDAPLSLMKPDMTGQPDISVDIPSDPAPDISDNPAASPDKTPDIAPGSIEARIAELIEEGWAPWNAKAKARSEAEWRNREVRP